MSYQWHWQVCFACSIVSWGQATDPMCSFGAVQTMVYIIVSVGKHVLWLGIIGSSSPW